MNAGQEDSMSSDVPLKEAIKRKKQKAKAPSMVKTDDLFEEDAGEEVNQQKDKGESTSEGESEDKAESKTP